VRTGAGRLLRRLLLGLVLMVAIGYQARVTMEVMERLLDASRFVRTPFTLGAGTRVIESVAREYHGKLRHGDILLSVNGRPLAGSEQLMALLQPARPGETARLTVRAPGSGEIRSVAIVFRPAVETARDLAFIVMLMVVMPAFCLALGFWVVLVRVDDPLAWLLLGLMASFSQFLLRIDLHDWGVWERYVVIIWHSLSARLWPVWMLLFGIYFPARLKLDRRYPWCKWLLVAPLVAGTALSAVVESIGLTNLDSVAAIAGTLNALAVPITVIGILAVAGFFAALGMKTYHAASPDARRRLRLLRWGAAAALVPLVTLLLWSTAGRPVAPWFRWMVVPALMATFLFPLTLAYVIVVQRAMDVRVVIRQSVQYALAQRGLWLLQGLVSLGIVFSVVSLVQQPNVNRAAKLTYIGLGILLIILLRRFAGKVRLWVDRRFFREALNAEQVLAELSEQVRSIVETRPLLEVVARRIAESLHVERIALLLNEGGWCRPAFALGYGGVPAVSFPGNTSTVQNLNHGEPLRVYLDDPDSWVYREPGFDPSELARLRALDSRLLLPLSLKDRLLGFISLSPKRSEEPYSANDVRLLQSVATQAGLALENSRLSEQVAREVAQRERISREIEIAREVQERLFPQSLPEIEGLDYAGACRPAQEVGGDYFDFLKLAGGEFGFAIGDVSGKGISAALLMASLQASIRSQTLSGNHDLAGLMTNVNRLIYDSSASNRYATLFYAQYDPASRMLRYVNAGHNPPFVLRANTVIPLDTGGPVVGLLQQPRYEQGSLVLEPADLVVCYTDGISESLNAAEQEWGEQRLIETTRSWRAASAGQILDHIMDAATKFAAGAPQHDDMTLVIVRIGN